MLFTLSVVAFVFLVLLTLWIYRTQAIEYLPPRLAARFREYQPLQTFANASGAGFNSTSFSLADNLEEGESRSGLDEAGLTEVRRIMDGHRVGFDEARLIRQQRIMRKNGIDPATGLPLDSKAITSLG